MFGPPVLVEPAADGQVGIKPAPGGQRRSIYMLHRRLSPLTMLETFDAPRMTTNCVQRRTSTVVSQALLLLNSEFMDVEAARLAERVVREAGKEPTAQVDRAYALVLGRPAAAREREVGLQFLQKQASSYADKRPQALADLCLVLLNSAEFLYID
jgi:hypothetical protein